jgi:hypothetical protein
MSGRKLSPRTRKDFFLKSDLEDASHDVLNFLWNKRDAIRG